MGGRAAQRRSRSDGHPLPRSHEPHRDPEARPEGPSRLPVVTRSCGLSQTQREPPGVGRWRARRPAGDVGAAESGTSRLAVLVGLLRRYWTRSARRGERPPPRCMTTLRSFEITTTRTSHPDPCSNRSETCNDNIYCWHRWSSWAWAAALESLPPATQSPTSRFIGRGERRKFDGRGRASASWTSAWSRQRLGPCMI